MLGRNSVISDPDPTVTLHNSTPNNAPAKLKRVVLVVDDTPAMSLLILSILKLYGCEALSATDGQHALIMLAEHPEIAAIVTDLNMPTMDGFGLLAALNSGGSAVPVVVVTAQGAESDQHRWMELGARALLNKPFSRRQLWAVVAPLLALPDAG